MSSRPSNIVAFLFGFSPRTLVASVFAGAVSGGCSAALLGIINSVVKANGAVGATGVAAFIAMCAIVPSLRYVSESLLNQLGQNALYSLRLKLCRMILAVPLRQLEQIGAARLLTVLTDDVPTIAATVLVVPQLCINAAVMIGCLIYMATLSRTILLTVLVVMVAGIAIYYYLGQQAQRVFSRSRDESNALLGHWRALVQGTKELKSHRKRRQAFITKVLEETADSFRRHSIAGVKLYIVAASFGQALVFVLVGFVIMVLPLVGHTNSAMLTGYTIALLYLMTPVQAIMNSVPALGRATVALNRLNALGGSLAAQESCDVAYVDEHCQFLNRLEFDAVTHSYYREQEDSSFSVGPINLIVRPGEMVFITGGNGSGKTTFAKLLTGLYMPEEGGIRLDGHSVSTAEDWERYRQYFAAVFSDCFLFDQLLGLTVPDVDSKAAHYLNELGLTKKVTIKDGRLSTVDLSQGQRKRLALLTAYLEDRPIYVFDEWAADQDPQFKDVFYLLLLSELKSRQKTIFVITHDDRYYHVADRIIKFEDGQIVADSGQAKGEAMSTDWTATSVSRVGSADRAPAREVIAKAEPDAPTGFGLFPKRFSFLVWGLMVAVAAITISAVRPPRAVPANAPSQDFSAGRAMDGVRVIARTPHPVGSYASEQVRQYLLGQLSSLGANPGVISGIGVFSRGGPTAIGNVQDVIGRLPGTGNSHAIMLVAHYDSVYRAPGAADDGSGVAAILETVRAVRAGPRLKNDLIILFTDGEESGLLGAEALAAKAYPWTKQVGLIMNFEARGNRGPSLLFETSPGNLVLMREVARAAPYPFASSLFYTFYKQLPNDTDFTVFRKEGISGLNFAFGGNIEAYHSRLDTVAALSADSLQHQGSYALALTRHFGQMDLRLLQQRTNDALFFNYFGSHLITYSMRAVLPIQIGLTLLLASVVALRELRARGDLWRVLSATALCLAFMVVIPAMLGASWLMIARVLGRRLIAADSTADSLLLAGLVLLGTAAGTALLFISFKRLWIRNPFVPTLLSLLVLSWFVAIKWPAGSYLISVPLLVMTFVVLALRLLTKTSPAVAQVLSSLAGTVVLIALFAPMIYLLYIFVTLQLPVVIAAGLCVGFVLLISMPLCDHSHTRRWWPIVSISLAAITILMSGLILSQPSNEHPGRDSLVYSMNADSHTACWISFDQALDRWTSQFVSRASSSRQPLREYLAGDTRPVFAAPAAPLALPPPEEEVVSHTQEGNLHSVHLKIRSVRGADVLRVVFADGIEGVAARIADRQVPLTHQGGRLTFILYGMADKHVDVIVTVRAPVAVSLWLMDESFGLPPGLPDRPPDLMAGYGSDVTGVCRRYTL